MRVKQKWKQFKTSYTSREQEATRYFNNSSENSDVSVSLYSVRTETSEKYVTSDDQSHIISTWLWYGMYPMILIPNSDSFTDISLCQNDTCLQTTGLQWISGLIAKFFQRMVVMRPYFLPCQFFAQVESQRYQMLGWCEVNFSSRAQRPLRAQAREVKKQKTVSHVRARGLSAWPKKTHTL